MDLGIDAELPSLCDFSRIRIYPDNLARSNLFQDDSSEQSVATSEVEPSPIWKTVRDDLADLDRTPERSGRLERIFLKKPDEEVASQAGTSARALSTSPRPGQLSRYR